MKKLTLKSLVVLAICLIASTTLANKEFNDNVVIVLDGSGSMDGMLGKVMKITAAKQALKEVLKQVPQSTHIGLLVFSDSVKNKWVYPLGPRDDIKINQAIDKIRSDGGTPLGEYMEIAANRLLQEREAQFGYGKFKLLIVTDGEAGDSISNISDIISRGIIVDVIGVDMAEEHTLAELAHSYRRADDPESLKKAIADIFAEVGSSNNKAADAEIFELLAPLPTEIAIVMIDALANTGNHPIGQQPTASIPDKAAPAAQQQGVTVPEEGCGAGSIILIVVLIICAFIVLLALAP